MGNMDNNLDDSCHFHCKFCKHQSRTYKMHLFHSRVHRHISKYLFCGLGRCLSSFKSESGLRNHVIRNHKFLLSQAARRRTNFPINVAGKVQCSVPLCGKEFFTHRHFMSHLKNHLSSGTRVPCPHNVTGCQSVSSSWSSLTGHISRKHRQTQASCEEVASDTTTTNRSSTEDAVTDYDPLEFLIVEDFEETPQDCAVSLAQFYQKLEYKHMVPGVVTQLVANEIKTLFMDVKRCFLNNLASTLESEGISQEKIPLIISSAAADDTLLQNCNILRSNYMRKKFYRDNFCFVEPFEVPLERGHFFYFVPLKETICAAFKNKSWMFCSKQNTPSPDGCLKDFFDGEVYKNNSFFQENPEAIPIILYQDGFQVVCPIGPAKNLKHKLVGIYMAFGNLPSDVRFERESIQLIALCRECDFQHDEVYGKIVESIVELQTSGVYVNGVGTVKAGLAFVSGDNLGSHALGGLLENFSCAKYFCRFCLLQRHLFYKRGGAFREFPRRTVDSYNKAVDKIRVTAGNKIISCQGVKFDSEFNKVEGFHVCAPGLPPCLGHDLCEGVIAYDLKLFIQYFVAQDWFDLEELNMLINSFPYSEEDRKDKPVIIKCLEKEKMAGGAWQLWQCIRLFPLIVYGHIKDPNDSVWKLLLLLRSIAEKTVSPEIHKSQLSAYQYAIDEYLLSRLEIFPYVRLRPKHHYLKHYPEMMRFFGPMIKVWTLRFESKHQFFNRSWRSSNNSINILKTLAFKHEYFQSWIRSGGGIRCTGFDGRKPVLLTLYSEAVLSALEGCQTSFLDECNSVTIKGTCYKKGSVLVLNQTDFGEMLEVGIVHLILIDKQEKVTFLVRKATAHLIYKFGAYKLNKPTEFSCATPSTLLSYYPLTKYVRDSESYLCLRHALVSKPLD